MATANSYYLYDPSEVAAAALAIIFGISFLLTAFQIIHRRSWVWVVFLLALAMEVIGFVARVISARDITEKGPYVIQFTLILLAPVLMAGVIYVLFGRIVFWVVPPEQRTTKLLWCPPRFITLIFVGFDVISLLLQLIAAVLITSSDPTEEGYQDKVDLGRTLGCLGVGVQLAGFGLFSIVAIRFHFTSRKVDENFAKTSMANFGIKRHWSHLLLVINFSCLMILIRSCFRMVEFAEGKGGVVHTEEWYLYVLDVLPVLLAGIAYNVIFPGRYLKHLSFRMPKQYRALPKDVEAMGMTAWTPTQGSNEGVVNGRQHGQPQGYDSGYQQR